MSGAMAADAITKADDQHRVIEEAAELLARSFTRLSREVAHFESGRETSVQL
jgi:hypothetical protein